MSCSGWRTVISAVDFVPSANVREMVSAPATTWRQVRMSPARSTMTPLPRPLFSVPFPPGDWVWIRTRDGRTASYTCWETAGAGVCEARAWATVSLTSRLVSRCGPGLSTPYRAIARSAAATPEANRPALRIRGRTRSSRRDDARRPEPGGSSIWSVTMPDTPQCLVVRARESLGDRRSNGRRPLEYREQR